MLKQSLNSSLKMFQSELQTRWPIFSGRRCKPVYCPGEKEDASQGQRLEEQGDARHDGNVILDRKLEFTTVHRCLSTRS